MIYVYVILYILCLEMLPRLISITFEAFRNSKFSLLLTIHKHRLYEVLLLANNLSIDHIKLSGSYMIKNCEKVGLFTFDTFNPLTDHKHNYKDHLKKEKLDCPSYLD